MQNFSSWAGFLVVVLALLTCVVPILIATLPSSRLLLIATVALSIVAGAFMGFGISAMYRAADSLDGGTAALARSEFYLMIAAAFWLGALLLGAVHYVTQRFEQSCRAQIDRLLAG